MANNNDKPALRNDNIYEYMPDPQICFNITVRNSAMQVDRCLKSVVGQKGGNWRCIITDDHSSDETWNVIKRYMPKIEGYRNDKRSWKAYSFHQAMSLFNPQDVIVELDGDDELLTASVVRDITYLHKSYDLVWTQHTIDKSMYPDWHFWPSTSIPDSWNRKLPIRDNIWTRTYHPGHLRTFKRFLYDHIRISDLHFAGNWLKCSFDSAYYTALLELTLPEHRYFYNRALALYRIEDHNDTFATFKMAGRKEPVSQSYIAKQLQKLPIYRPIIRPHIGILLSGLRDFSTIEKSLQSLCLKFPEVFIYIGLLENWGQKRFYKYQGIRFFNLKQIILTFHNWIQPGMVKVDGLSKSIFAQYLLNNIPSEKFIILSGPDFDSLCKKAKDSINHFWGKCKRYADEMIFKSSDLEMLRRMIEREKIKEAGSKGRLRWKQKTIQSLF